METSFGEAVPGGELVVKVQDWLAARLPPEVDLAAVVMVPV